MPLSIPPSVPLPMPLLRRHPFCRLAYTVLFIVHAIHIPSCKPGFKHGRPPCPRCRRILLVSLLFHHCLTPLLSFIRPHDQSYRPYMEHLASSPAAPSAANIYTHLNDAHILHAKDKIESVLRRKWNSPMKTKLHKSCTNRRQFLMNKKKKPRNLNDFKTVQHNFPARRTLCRALPDTGNSSRTAAAPAARSSFAKCFQPPEIPASARDVHSIK